MEIETQRTIHRIHYTILIISLLAVSLGLLGVIGITTKAYADADEKIRDLLFHLAWVGAATLAVTLVLLAWVIMRWIRFRLQTLGKGPDMHYVDAWSEAGKRIPVPETDDVVEEPDEFTKEDLPGEIDEDEDEGEDYSENQSW